VPEHFLRASSAGQGGP